MRSAAPAEVRSLTPRRPLWGRFSAGHLLMVVAGLLALVLNFAVLSSRNDAIRVATAAEDIRAGSVVTASSFDFTDVRVDGEVLLTLVRFEEAGSLNGLVANRSIPAGQLIASADFAVPSASDALRAFSISIDSEHAVGGALTPGDRVDVISVSEGSAEYVAVGLEVLDVPEAGSGFGGGGRFFVTVAVDADLSLRLAVAVREEELEIVRSTGAAEPSTLEYESDSSDAGSP